MITYLQWSNIKIYNDRAKTAREFLPNIMLTMPSAFADLALIALLHNYLQENPRGILFIGFATGYLYAKNDKQVNAKVKELLSSKDE